ncbi:MAG: transcriptional repressor LexA [Clostridia bacterium]|nr:transcriptional repressor LexA [Clostridia bacterium]
MDTDKLTKNQLAILEYIRSYVDANKVPPTVRDICKGTGLRSTSTVHTNLRFLSDNGFVQYTPGTRRSITVSGVDADNSPASTGVSIPLVGSVAAGVPILAVENIQEYYRIPDNLIHGTSRNETFMLRIKGESMIEAGILENDYIIVNSAASVSNGEIAVVRIDDSVTVKRFYLERDRVRLLPENSAMEPIFARPEDVDIVGKVVGLIRNF